MPEELSEEIKREILRLVDERVSELHVVVDDKVRDILEEKEYEESREKIDRQEAFEERWNQHRIASEKREELEL